jgi:hypothetical protein
VTFLFHPEAEAEFNRAIDYYEEVEPGLGFDFAIEVQLAIQRSVTFPKAWPFIEVEIRRCLVRRFPFGILYSIENGGISVIAVMHLHRMPEYWKHRK